MAGWQTVLAANDTYEVSVTSHSWWRWRWAKLRHLPYFVGDCPTFAITIRVLKGKFDNKVYWSLLANSQRVAQAELEVKDETQKHILLEMPMLAVSGKYALTMLPANPSNISNEQAAYSFSVVTREGFIIKLLLPTVFGSSSIAIAAWNLARTF